MLGMWDRRNAYRVFMEIPERKGTLGSSRRKWQTNTKNISKRNGLTMALTGLIWLRKGRYG
jgi:hypothetical protein